MRVIVSFLLLFVLFTVPTDLTSAASNVERLSGSDRFEVAAKVSQKGWQNADTIIIANYVAFADALSAAPLAFQVNGPILLSRNNTLTATTKEEIRRLKPKKAIIVGGNGSVSDKVINEFKSMNIKTERIGGKDRYEVALNISKKLKDSDTAIITNGLVFSDALTIAPYAAKNGFPILLTAKDSIPAFTTEALKGKTQRIVIGGEGSVGKKVYETIGAQQRIGGKDRYEVAANIATQFTSSNDHTFIATGLTFADALTGSVLAAKNNVPLLLTRPDRLPKETYNVIKQQFITNYNILGGPGSIQDKVIKNDLPAANTHSIEGYSEKISFFPGETIDLRVHAPEGKFSIDFMRFGKEQKLLHQVQNIPGKAQHYFSDAYKEGVMWTSSYQFTIPKDWETGMYAARLYDQAKEFYVTFIVKDKNPSENDIAVLASTNTWQAYNSWAGKSLYSNEYINGANQPVSYVSFNRPNPGATPLGDEGHLANGERHILSWLEQNNHNYDMLSDHDFHENPDILKPYKILIISTHSEYWSTTMYNGLEKFLNQGGNLLYLSGNGVYWKVAIKDDKIEVKRDGSKHTLSNEAGGLFYTSGSPESALLGVGYRHTGFSVPAPYKVIDSNHWIFKNTDVQNGDLIGQVGLNTTRQSTGGASGWETDQVDQFTPSNYNLLAQGTNTVGKGADMIYYDHPGGGGVFSVGSITFGGSLIIDPTLSTMVNNVINKFQSE
ncbi:N,N-dimethylformamidase beta subunit family domain-containing protein [Fredinandcohnia sp. FSL W7-1320]|uniref:N,N-dimethylformamidase beta subunit family domain-containing protein n=1 Tax=Fredinandcohnia sp. FSL W7-1320 TaxID=2954540 RepID=UPI0030FD755A